MWRVLLIGKYWDMTGLNLFYSYVLTDEENEFSILEDTVFPVDNMVIDERTVFKELYFNYN